MPTSLHLVSVSHPLTTLSWLCQNALSRSQWTEIRLMQNVWSDKRNDDRWRAGHNRHYSCTQSHPPTLCQLQTEVKFCSLIRSRVTCFTPIVFIWLKRYPFARFAFWTRTKSFVKKESKGADLGFFGKGWGCCSLSMLLFYHSVLKEEGVEAFPPPALWWKLPFRYNFSTKGAGVWITTPKS